MKRIEHRDERGRLVGVELTDRDTADVTHAIIEVQSGNEVRRSDRCLRALVRLPRMSAIDWCIQAGHVHE